MNKEVWAVAKIQLYKSFRSSRTLLLAFFVPIFLLGQMIPVMFLARDAGIGITPFGSVFVFSDYTGGVYLRFYVLMGAVLLFSDLPMLDSQREACVLRCGRKTWLNACILQIVIMSVIYTLYWAVQCILVILPYIEWSAKWGSVWKTLAMTDAGAQYSLMFSPAFEIIRDYQPVYALVLSIVLKIMMCSLIGFVIFIGNMASRASAGTIAAAALAFQDIFSFYPGYSYVWFSPATMTRLSALDKAAAFLKPSPPQAIAVMLMLNAVLVFGVHMLRNRNLRLM